MSLTLEQAFQILEVPPTATWEEVRQAYREMVKVWHPDRFQDDAKFQARATKKAQDINLAYQLLEKHFQSPPPSSSQRADEMFERWAKDSQKNHPYSPHPQTAYFPNLQALLLYVSSDQPYGVYPCHITRSNSVKWTANKLAGILLLIGAALKIFSRINSRPDYFGYLCLLLVVVVMGMDWAGNIAGRKIPDAFQLTDYGVAMIEGIHLHNGYFTSTTCHFFTYDKIGSVNWREGELSFQTSNGIKFTFKPTCQSARTKPDTRCFTQHVFSTADVIAYFQSKGA
jgi:hypothetical protein